MKKKPDTTAGAKLKVGTERSPKNKTIRLSAQEERSLERQLLDPKKAKNCLEGVYNGDYRSLIPWVKEKSVNLLILDPPYNLDKDFRGKRFSKKSVQEYTEFLDDALTLLKPLLAEDASVYICGDWYSSLSIFAAASRHFFVRNRISWEREKGRGARLNWKNSSEDIWFCTVSDQYTFNLDKVKLRRKVIAPYKDKNGKPKDWLDTAGGAFRDTHPSNFWTDITIPFWSMPENTEHPTQKSEKLLAKLILASSNAGDLVFDPFAGSGTSSVVAAKLGRRHLSCEIDRHYCLLALKRLALAGENPRIQGFADGVFWERNTLAEQQAIESETD